MKLEEYMQIHLDSGNKGKDFSVISQELFHFLDYDSRMENDGFLHLIYSASPSVKSRFSYELVLLPSYQFICVQEGTLEVVCDGKSPFRAAPGQYLFLSPAKSYRFSIKSGPCRFFQAGLLGASLSSYRKLLPVVIGSVTSGTSSFLSDSIHHLLNHHLYHSAIDTVMYSKWLNDMFAELSIYMADSSLLRDQIPSYLKEIKRMFDESYQESYTLEDLERRFETSRYRLCREFSHYFGRSPIQYLNHRRVEAAKVLLISTNMSVHEVGSSVGIDNTNHFINVFKKETGATPLVFKQEAPAAISELHCPCEPDVRPR